MRDPYFYPKLRWPIDLSIQGEGQQAALVMRCPIGLSPQPLALIPGLAPIISEFTGQNSLANLVIKFQNYGVSEELLRELVKILDQNLFLETPNFFNRERQIKDEYHASGQRLPALANLSYPADPVTLTKEIENYLALNKTKSFLKKDLVALVAPHIDYRRGGSCYGNTYSYLRQQNHDLLILMGTAHQYSPQLFHLCSKDFITPLGVLPCKKSLVSNLAKLYGIERSFADEFLHKNEHSLELQTPFLKHLTNNVAILPILIGSFYSILQKQILPNQHQTYEDFAGALTEVLRNELKSGTRIGFISGVDMAHIGQAFGDKDRLTPDFMDHIRSRDEVYLNTIVQQDKKSLFEHISEDNDARRICGFPSMYLMLDVLARLEIKYDTQIYDYQQAVDYKSDCAVTFAGMGFYQR